MLDLNELKWIKEVLESLENQDEMNKSITEKINKVINDAESNKQCLWSFYWNCGRQGDVEGLFKATKEEVENAIGMEVYFGEILGKHSEVYGRIEEGEIELESDDPIVVLNAKESGYNPLDYLRYVCSLCGDKYSSDEWNFEKSICEYCSDNESDKSQ